MNAEEKNALITNQPGISLGLTWPAVLAKVNAKLEEWKSKDDNIFIEETSNKTLLNHKQWGVFLAENWEEVTCKSGWTIPKSDTWNKWRLAEMTSKEWRIFRDLIELDNVNYFMMSYPSN